MIARYLEEHGVPTVVMGCAKDIVESAGVARFWWSDFPLGHSAGKPHDEASQQATLAGALALFDSVAAPNTTVASDQIWSDDEGWKDDFMSIAHFTPEKIAALKADHENTRATKRAIEAK